ncbi:MAG: glycosyltransferase [Candidatus Thorarchaeota archaeon]
MPPERAGEAEYTASLIRELSARGVRVLAIAGKNARPLNSPNVTTAPIWDGRQLTYPFRLASFLRRNRPHILHVQFGPDRQVYGGFFGEVMLILLLLARLMGIKTTVTLHSTWMPAQVVERVKTYRLLSKFAVLAAPFFRLYMRLLDWGTNTIQLSTVRLNSALRRRFLREYKIRAEKVLEIPHPCRPVRSKPGPAEARRALGLEGREPLLIFGFIRRGKGIEVAVKAIAEVARHHPSVLLLIAGSPWGEDGEFYLLEIRELIERLGVSKWVRLDTEFIPSERVPLYFAAAALILLPYEDSVGASGPAHNYAGYGVPIVAADVGLHMREALGGSVVLFRSKDATDLSHKIVELLDDPAWQARIGQALREYATHEDWTRAAARTIAHYMRTLTV